MCLLRVRAEGRVSQIKKNVGLSFLFVSKIGKVFVFILQWKFLHFLKQKLGPKSISHEYMFKL